MTKSRTALLAFTLGAAWPVATLAQALTTEEAMARQQTEIRDVLAQRCPRGVNGNEVVVCGRREPVQRYRAPLRIVSQERAGDRAGGEQLAQLDAGDTRCSTAVHDQRCNRGLSVISVGAGGVGGIAGMVLPGLSEDE